jgi:nitronate monooxygenase
VDAVLAAGAAAAQLGTAFLRSDESGARQLHKDALAGPGFTETRLTRAFTGRQARALANSFVLDHADAPEGYPAIHHLTSPIRAAAAAAGDPERLNLWAGTGWRQASDGPVAAIMAGLLAGSALA